jgi:triacylglycerol esterase/lipase EstA (alpha/beta hydrolase family)
MTFIKKPLIIIPGLGDRAKQYRIVMPIWKLLGYEPYVFSFGWEDAHENFAVAIERLTDYIDNLHATRINIIGVSAGGTAAINALALRPSIVNRVVTVSTPYRFLPHLKNAKLKASIAQAKRIDVSGLGSRVLSIHGLHDKTVPIGASKPEGVRARKVYMINHGFIIATSLTLYGVIIRRFLEEGS